MANDVVQAVHVTGKTVYIQIWNDSGQILDVAAGLGLFEPYSTAAYADYDIPATELGTASQIYNATFPAVVAAGIYRITWRENASFNETDLVITVDEVEWNGSRLTGNRQSLIDFGVDHLVSAAVVGADITDNSIIAKLVSKSATADWDTFDNTTDSLEAHTDAGGNEFLRTGTLQAGSTSTTAKLDAGASAIDDFYNNNQLTLRTGTGAGQSRLITDYDGTTKVATVSPAWLTTPDGTTTFLIESGYVHSETLQAGSLAGAVWDEARASHTTVGTFGEGSPIAPDGLNGVDISDPLGEPGNFTERMNWVFMRFGHKNTLTATALSTFDSAGTSVITTQSVSNDGVTETQGKAVAPL